MKKGLRYNKGKPKWSLVPQSSLIPMVEVLEFGAKKYEAFNWMKGLSINEICESLKRHLDSFMEGEDIDPESNLSHIGHIQCNSLFLSWMMEHRKDLDDRVNVNNFKPINKMTKKRIDLEFVCIDYWNRVIYKWKDKEVYFASLSVLFPNEKIAPNGTKEEMNSYFRDNDETIELFGSDYHGDPLGGRSDKWVFNIID